MDIFKSVGERIRDLRTRYGDRGISQQALGKALGVTANTISRWETATYHPTLEDLDRLARFFGVPIGALLPESYAATDEIAALVETARQLPADDLAEVRRFAEFRRTSTAALGRKPPRKR